MKLSDYNYNLPENLIANKPSLIRGSSRLLVIERLTGNMLDKKYYDIADYLNKGDTLVLNDTKVIKARLKVTKENGAVREFIILEKHSFDNDWHRHRVLYRKKIKVGDRLKIGEYFMVVEEIQGDGLAIIKSSEDLLNIVEKYGEVPLPPYIHRKAEAIDVERYQTVWAKDRGSVAAPTASLNMTNDILEKIKSKGVNVVYITLHVGLGTFLPIRTNNIEEHHMHQEFFKINADAIKIINDTKLNGHRVFALGTTVARTLEYSSDYIDKVKTDISGEADIFIYPGYQFKLIDCLITNFHAPKSTVLMLTAAFVGWDKLLPAYEYAIKQQYSLLSYGDSMLIL